MSALIQLKHSEIKKLKQKLHTQQGHVCPLLGLKFDYSEMVLDHQHSSSKETVGVNGAGQVRGAIHRGANSLEGRITNAFVRYGLHKYSITVPEFLRNLADYLEQDNLPYIHPTEKPKTPKLKKSSYNKLIKALKKAKHNKKIPAYPKSKKLTTGIKKLFKQVKLTPEFYKP